VGSVFFHLVSYEFEDLSHAVLGHFLFSLFQFLEFTNKTAEY